jgi:nuclease-like protein
LPEKGQAYGTRAKQAASELVLGGEVTLQTYGKDKYGRTLADVLLLDSTNVNHTLVEDGWGWWYRKYAPGDTVQEGLEKAYLISTRSQSYPIALSIYQIQRQLLSDPTRGFSFEGAPSHTHFGPAKNKWPAPLSRTGHLLFGLS